MLHGIYIGLRGEYKGEPGILLFVLDAICILRAEYCIKCSELSIGLVCFLNLKAGILYQLSSETISSLDLNDHSV